MGADMEMSCDERVMKELGGQIKHNYSLSLVRMSVRQRILNGSPLAFGEGRIKERVKNVLNFKKKPRIIIIAAVALVAVLTVGFAMSRTKVTISLPLSDNITKMELRDGTNGNPVEITNYDTLQMILTNFNKIYMTKDKSSKDNVGWSYALKFFAGDETVLEVVVIGEKRVKYNGYFYDVTNGSIDCDYLKAALGAPLSINFAGLFALKTPYVGNNSAVGKIITSLPPFDQNLTQRFFSIDDGYSPNTLTIYYEHDGKIERNISRAPADAALLFALIGNLEKVEFAFRDKISGAELDKAAYTSRIAFNKEQITEFIGTIGLAWEDFDNNFAHSIERLFGLVDVGAVPSPEPSGAPPSAVSPGGMWAAAIVEPFLDEPVPPLENERYILRVLGESPETMGSGHFGIYRNTEAEPPELFYYAYWQLGGVKYNLGPVGYGTVETIDGAYAEGLYPYYDETINLYVSSTGARFGTEDFPPDYAYNNYYKFYNIVNGKPQLIYCIGNLLSVTDVDGDGLAEAVAVDGGGKLSVYKFDAENRRVLIADAPAELYAQFADYSPASRWVNELLACLRKRGLET